MRRARVMLVECDVVDAEERDGHVRNVTSRSGYLPAGLGALVASHDTPSRRRLTFLGVRVLLWLVSFAAGLSTPVSSRGRTS